MKIIKLVCGMLGVNSYVVVNEDTSTAVVFDPANYEKLKQIERDNKIKIEHAVFTHGHFDHITAGAKLKNDGALTHISSLDAPMLYTDQNLGSRFRIKVEEFYPDHTFNDGDILELSGMQFNVMLTPGHTIGSCCFIIDNVIFSGDTLFYESVGRTDFPGGNFKTLKKSLDKLVALGNNYIVLPGHGKETTIEYEKENNVYINEY